MGIINMNAENIDYEGALCKLGNSINLYKIILVGFKNKYSDAYDDLVILGAKNKYTEARILSHSLKGVCGNLGASNLETISRKLEYSYLNEDGEYLQLLDDFRQELSMVLEDIDGILDCINRTNGSK